MARYSKLQLEVLKLYKKFLREAGEKPGISCHIRKEFKKYAAIQRTDTLRIEHILRRSHRQLEQLKTSNVKSIGVFSNDKKD